MDILPLVKIREDDALLVGEDIINLAKLVQWELPVAEAVVVFPPELQFKSVLKHYNLKSREVFEASLTIIKKEILKLKPPEDLIKLLKQKQVKNHLKVYQGLLEGWLAEVRSKIWREGSNESINLNLSAECVFFTQNIVANGQAYLDNDQVKVEGVVTPADVEGIEDLVLKAQKKLLLPQVFHFILVGKSRKVEFVKLTPYTPNVTLSKAKGTDSHELYSSTSPQNDKYIHNDNSAVKLFLDLSEDLILHSSIDGILICGEKSSQHLSAISRFEFQVLRLVEAARSLPQGQVIFKLSDVIEHKAGVRGVLRLIHQQSLLKEDAEAVLFARNKQQLLNVSAAIPFVRSVYEFLQIKRDLAVLGLSRKGSLKLWLELCVPENIINLEEYLVAGQDGVIINLDELSSAIGGFDLDVPESIFYKKQISALLKLLEDGLKLLHKSKVPVLVSGKLSQDQEVLEFLISRGLYGVVADLVGTQSFKNHLQFIEHRVLRQKIN